MIVDLERRGMISAQTGESPAVPAGRVQMIVDALERLGISSVYYTEGINSTDPMAVTVDGLHKAARTRQEQADGSGLTITAQPDYEAVLAQAHTDSGAAIVPAALGGPALREHHMGQVSFVPFADRLDVSVLAPLHVISPRDFEPVTANLPKQGA